MLARTPGVSFYEAASRDRRVQQMHEFNKQGHYKLPVMKLNNELCRLQANRKFPRLNEQAILSDTQATLVAASQETAAINSRASYIKMVAHVRKRRLDEHIRQVERHLLTEYDSILRHHVKEKSSSGRVTDTAQKKAVHDVLRPFYEISYQLETLIMTADILLADLTRSGYAMDLDERVIKMQFQPQRNI